MVVRAGSSMRTMGVLKRRWFQGTPNPACPSQTGRDRIRLHPPVRRPRWYVASHAAGNLIDSPCRPPDDEGSIRGEGQ